MDSEAQAWDQIDDLCRRIWCDVRIFEDRRDPQVFDSLVLQVDLLLEVAAQVSTLEHTTKSP